jgi:nitric oxide reductase subunit B
VHIQAPIVWIGLSWIASALFLGPAVAGGTEARGQPLCVDLLFWATLIVIAGGLAGDYLGIMGYIRQDWFWFGNQGLSYIQLGRFWQIGFFAGLAFWSVLVLRALWPTAPALARATRQFWSGRIRLENLIWAATVNIAVLYAFGMIPLTGIEKSFTIADFWRWWVVHLWVEQSFEFFAACMSAYLLMATGLVSRILAERAVYFELILISIGQADPAFGFLPAACSRLSKCCRSFCSSPKPSSNTGSLRPAPISITVLPIPSSSGPLSGTSSVPVSSVEARSTRRWSTTMSTEPS